MSRYTLKRRWLGVTVFFAMFAIMVGCSQPIQQETGTASLGIATQALSVGDVKRVTITISGANVSPSIVQNMVKVGNQWKGIIGKIPAGTGRTFLAQAYDATTGGTLIYEGSATNVTIVKNQTVTVVILLQQKTAPDPFANRVPVINSVVASANAVGPGETVNLTVNATDPDTGDTLTYTWSAASGSFSSTTNTSTVWTAPTTTGNHTINIKVSDQKMGMTTASLVIDVQTYHSRGRAILNVSFNTWPTVTKVWADKGRINTGESTPVHVTATDNDNNTLTYSWASDCGGSFSSTTSTDPTFTAPGTAPTSGLCKLTVTVSDGNGGSTTGDVTIQIGAPLAANVAPLLITTFQSEENINNGATVTLRVVATDPNGDNMTFSWAEIGGPNGTLSTPTSTATTSELTWIADANKCSATIRVTVTDDGTPNASTSHDFSILCVSPPQAPQLLKLAVGPTSNTTCVTFPNQTTKCWGRNQVGQLGVGTTTNLTSPPTNPINVGTGRTTKQTISGRLHTCAILDNDTVKCWGDNASGQLGYGDTTARLTPSSNPINLGSGRTAKQLTIGSIHTCAILDNDTVKCWGLGTYGQLGNGSQTTLLSPPTNPINLGAGQTAKQIASGLIHTCALLDNDTVKCWGYNAQGQLGIITPTTRLTAPTNPVNLGTGRTAKQIGTGGFHTCALLDNNTVKCWGWNDKGELGYGNTTGMTVPSVTPINLGAGRTVKQLSVGGHHNCVILDNDTVKCWGWNQHGQLGYGNTTDRLAPPTNPVNLGAGRTAKEIRAYQAHTCALLDNGTVKCWGHNANGALGYGDTTNRNTPPTNPISGL